MLEARTLGVVQALLDAGLSVPALEATGECVLTSPAALQDEGACALLLAAGADPNWDGGLPLRRAATLGVVRTLLAAGANPCPASSHPPLLSPAALSDPEACALLIAAGANVNARSPFGVSPLCAVEAPAVAALLLDAGADATIVTRAGLTALTSPAASLDVATCKRLLGAGAPITPDVLQAVGTPEVGGLAPTCTLPA